MAIKFYYQLKGPKPRFEMNILFLIFMYEMVYLCNLMIHKNLNVRNQVISEIDAEEKSRLYLNKAIVL